MFSNSYNIIVFLIIVFSDISGAMELSEKRLLELARKDTPEMERIKASFLTAKLQSKQARDPFNLQLEAQTNRMRSHEKAVAAFIPINENFSQYKLGVTRATKYGVGVGLHGFTEKTSFSGNLDVAKAGVMAEVGIDLYKDIFGRLSRSKIEQADLGFKRAQIELKLNTKFFETQVRKLYWQWVAIEQSSLVTTELLHLAKKQLSEANQRRKENVADDGEVARYRAQVSGREAQLTGLQYQRRIILRSLKELIPDIAEKELSLAPLSLEKTISDVFQCTAVIGQQIHSPLHFTSHDEVIKILEQQQQQQKKIDKSYDRPDLKLINQVKYLGVSGSTSDAYNDFQDDGRTVINLGLQFSMPLEGKKKTTREILDEKRRKIYSAQKGKIKAKLDAFHFETLHSIKILHTVHQKQKENSQHLQESLKVSRKKYNQARLTVQELVSEEDSYFQSKLSEIDSKLAIITTLLDYTSVFDQTPCALNRI